MKDLVPVYKAEPPFMEAHNAYGFLGVILEDPETTKIQCHLCGKLFRNLSKHIYHKHKEHSDESYKEEFGLNNTTPLVCRDTRNLHRENFCSKDESEKKEIIKRLKKNTETAVKTKKKNNSYRTTKNTIQHSNRYGTCPRQVKELFHDEWKKLGRLPYREELCNKLKSVIGHRFGSYYNALKAWGVNDSDITHQKELIKSSALNARAEKDFYPKWDRETIREAVKSFVSKQKRYPTMMELRSSNGLPSREPFQRLLNSKKRIDIYNYFENELKIIL